jgi:hypothetical protein
LGFRRRDQNPGLLIEISYPIEIPLENDFIQKILKEFNADYLKSTIMLGACAICGSSQH